MRIAIDIETLQSGQAGIATVVKNLSRQFITRGLDVVFLGYLKSRAPKTLLRRVINAARHLFYILVELPVRLKREKVDVLIGPAFYIPLWMPRNTRSIVFVYDLIPMTAPTGQDRFNSFYRNTLGRLCARRADRIVTLSGCARREIHQRLGIPLNRIVVAPAAAAESWRVTPVRERSAILTRIGLSDRSYFLFAGANDPRKNLARLLQAYARCVAEVRDFPKLVIAGEAADAPELQPQHTQRLGIASRVTLTGYVTTETLRALYSGALGFVFVSLSEGFGLPVLEAMACGTSVITSNATSLPEVAGNAALLVDPRDVGQIAAAMKDLVGNPRLRELLVGLGRRRVRLFSWTRFARILLDLARELCDERPAAAQARKKRAA